jgi:transcriptional regulator with XRE-family HTH domain
MIKERPKADRTPDEIIANKFARLLYNERRRAGLSQTKLAAMIGKNSNSSVSYIESKGRVPDFILFIRIMKALKMDINKFAQEVEHLL